MNQIMFGRRRKTRKSFKYFLLAALALAAFYQFIMAANESEDSLAALSQKAAAECVPAQTPQVAFVVRVVDGDTVRVALDGAEHVVRYIGIDAPEDTKTKEYFGPEATVKNDRLVGGAQVFLYRDVSETDRYNRLLRYVLLADGTFVNLELVAQGYASAATYPPDTACAEVFLRAERQAREIGLGLWEMGGKP